MDKYVDKYGDNFLSTYLSTRYPHTYPQKNRLLIKIIMSTLRNEKTAGAENKIRRVIVGFVPPQRFLGFQSRFQFPSQFYYKHE